MEQLNALGFVWEKPDPWEVRFALAKVYYEEHGDLNMPAQYKADGIWLSKWLNEQRQVYIGNRPGKALREDQVRRLTEIGMAWDGRWSTAWEKSYLDAKAFYEANGSLKVPQEYRGASGKKLALWVLRQRALRNEGALSDEQIRLLDKIGMVWEVKDPWETGCRHAERFFRANGHLEMPASYACEDGYCLGKWISNQRTYHNTPTKYRYLSEEQTMRLESLGIVWRLSDAKWTVGFVHAKEYLEATKGTQWKTTYISPDGYKTGAWIRGQLRIWEKGGMREERVTALRGIGLLPEEKRLTVPRRKGIPAGGKRNDLQVESGR